MKKAPFLRPLVRRFIKDDEASASMEFALLTPIIMWVIFSVIESGWLMTQQTMLDRGLSLAMRDLRLGRRPNPTTQDVKQDICDYAGVLRDCINTIALEVVPMQDAIGGATAVCVDRSSNIAPTVTFNPGSHVEQNIMVARVCFVVDPLIPGAALGAALPKDATGGYHLLSYSAFVNEPA